MKKLFLLTIFLTLLLSLATVSAAERKIFTENEKYGVITVEDRSFIDVFGWFDKTLAVYTLDNHTSECFSYCYSEGVTILYESDSLFDEIDFKDRKGRTKQLGYSFLIEEAVEYNIPIISYGKSNETITIWNNFSRREWVKYNNQILPPGRYRWRIEANKEIGDSIDWVITTNGLRFDEWAWWDSITGEYANFSAVGSHSWSVPVGVTNVSILVIGGGGGGGAGGGNDGSGAGGGGGVIYNTTVDVSGDSLLDIYVGDGGNGESATFDNGENGTNSNITIGSYTIEAIGGGGGAGVSNDGYHGGSGGGGWGDNSATNGGTSTANGNDGGDGYAGGVGSRSGGGGGGSNTAGTNGNTGTGGDGGSGLTYFGQEFACGGGGGGSTGGSAGCAGAGAGGYGSNNGGTANSSYGHGGGGGGTGGYVNSPGGDGGSGLVFIRWLSSNDPTVTMHYPLENSNYTTTNTVVSNATVTSPHPVTNVSFYVNGVFNQSNVSGQNNTIYTFSVDLSDGTHTMYINATNDFPYSTAGETRTVNIDTQIPTVIVNSGSGLQDYGSLLLNHSINITATDGNLDTCWFNYDSTNRSFSCSSGAFATYSFELAQGINSGTIYVNDSFGNLNQTAISWSYKVLENNRYYNASTHETSSEKYTINVTANSSLTAVNLLINQTNYTLTDEGNGNWTYTGDVQLGITNNTISFNFTYGGSSFLSSYETYQDVSSLIWTICNATYDTEFLNISFKDEESLAWLNATVPSSTFTYYLGSGAINKTYNFVNNTKNPTYQFCASPNKTISVVPYFQYKNGTQYPQRVWNPSAQTYTNTLTSKTLYLLNVNSGIYVTIQVVNTANQVLEGVFTEVTRLISSVDTVVGQGTTGASGTVTFWLNPDFIHTFSLSKPGYDDVTSSFAPTQTSYTITMGSSSITNQNFFEGIAYSILPTNLSLINDTIYTFAFNLTSSSWTLTEYGFDLRLANGTIITGGSSTVEDTNIELLYNTTNESLIYMDYYWLINGTYTNATRLWVVYNTQYTGWSIATFFEDFTRYKDSGLFGLDEFGNRLIIFLIIFLTVGLMQFKFGLNSPVAVLSVLFLTVYFFDIVVGQIPQIRGIDNLLTYISGLALVITIILEANKK